MKKVLSVLQYFPESQDRTAEATQYALSKGVYRNTLNGKINWWTRSPGISEDFVATVAGGGGTSEKFEFAVNNQQITVRPVIVLLLNDTEKTAEENNIALENSDTAEEEQSVTDQDFSVGNIVRFGHYNQDNDSSNGTEPVEWIVLDTDGNIAVLMSRFGLDAKPYNVESAHITWENCTLRTWLNDEFLNEAFTPDELAMLATVFVKAEKNLNFETELGNDTYDRIFLLSISEVERYLPDKEQRSFP